MSNDETLYEKTVRKLKNKKFVVFILIIFALVIAASQFITGISDIFKFFAPKKTKLEANISLQQYDIMSESTQSPEMLETIEGDIDDIQIFSALIAEEVAEAIQPERLFEIKLDISENTLKSPHSLIAYIHIQGMVVQQSPLVKEFGSAKKLDLLAISQDPLYFDFQRNSLEISVRDRKGHFQREFIKVFKREDTFSFDTNSKILNKKIRFSLRKSKILLETLEVSGGSAEIIQDIQASLNSAVRKRLGDHEFLAISPLNRDDLQRKREEIKLLPLGPGKGEIIDQYNVDFIISGNIIIK